MLSKTGYISVGEVTEESVPVKDFSVTMDGKQMPILESSQVAKAFDGNPDDLENCEYLVCIEWIKTIPREDAYWGKGMFAIQHTCCRLGNRFTVEKLVHHFGIED